MSATGVKPTPTATDPELLEPGRNGNASLAPQEFADDAARQAELLRLLWDRRRRLIQTTLAALAASAIIALLIPNSYTSTAQLMPPDSQSASGMAMLAAMAGKAVGPGFANIAGDLLGMKSSGALFIGVLRSETSEDRLVDAFNLRKVYSTRLEIDARKKLDEKTVIVEDRKSGIISVSVTDNSPQRAADLANAYVQGLNDLVAQLSTSAAHRERVFLEGRLKVAKVELDDAAHQLAQFSSKNNTLDMQTEGRAMLDAAGMLAGQLIAAQSQLEGLRQIYTDNNSRVKAMSARVAELRKQLDRLSGAQNPQSRSGRASTTTTANRSSNTANADPPSASAPDLSSGKVGDLPFPTIRNLPLLGATYADYYRRAKIQETVFELLTEQYEMAKVEEAKETPSVKILDVGKVPEKKSSPSRLLIIFLGTFFAFAGSIVAILGRQQWEQANSNDPRKKLAQEVLATLKARMPWTMNGHGSAQDGGPPTPTGQDAVDTSGIERSLGQRIWSRLRRRPPTNGAGAE